MCLFGLEEPYAIRNETSIGGRAIKTIQHQNDIGVVHRDTALKGEHSMRFEVSFQSVDVQLKPKTH